MDELDAEALLQVGDGNTRQAQYFIETGSADDMDPARVLTQPDYPAGAFRRGCKMDVGEFGDSMPHRLVHAAHRLVSAVDVGDGDTQGGRGDGRREGLDPVAEDEECVGPERLKGLGETIDPDPDPFGHRTVALSVEKHVDA